jgi:hypothetical protein
MSRNADAVRMLDGPVAEDPEPVATAKGGFRDTKKVVVLLVLALVGAGIVGYQFIGGKSPQAATADTAGAPLPVSALTGDPSNVDSVHNQLKAKSQDSTSVTGVEELVRRFDTYVQDRQVPLNQLHMNPFEVVIPKAAPAPGEPASAASPTLAAAEAAQEAKIESSKKRVRDLAASLTLGSVMLVGDRRMAVISGKLCTVGDHIGALQVERIESERVVLACDGEQVELRLRPKKPLQEGV